MLTAMVWAAIRLFWRVTFSIYYLIVQETDGESVYNFLPNILYFENNTGILNMTIKF